jgi:hypothetical protein
MALGTAYVGCTATARQQTFGDAGGGSATSASIAASASATGSGQGGAMVTASSTEGVGGLNLTAGSGPSDAGIGKDAACASSSEQAQLVPLTMFITVDKSGSMADNNKFPSAQSAFTQFFNDPSAAGLKVALRFWPDDGCDDIACTYDPCSKPQVDLGPLSDPVHRQALIDKFNAEVPNGGTPMSVAVGGAEKWASLYAESVMGKEKVVVVLLTDGEPTSCNTDIQFIANLADSAYNGQKVVTFAVGFPDSNEIQMNQIAAGGHSGMAFLIQGNVEAALLAALQQIQKSQLSCTFAMPKGSDPLKKPDPTKINVDYTPGNGGMTQTLGQVSGFGACMGKEGWYYDDPVNPTTINLCPASCQIVQADTDAMIEILLGCATHVG